MLEGLYCARRFILCQKDHTALEGSYCFRRIILCQKNHTALDGSYCARRNILCQKDHTVLEGSYCARRIILRQKDHIFGRLSFLFRHASPPNLLSFAAFLPKQRPRNRCTPRFSPAACCGVYLTPTRDNSRPNQSVYAVAPQYACLVQQMEKILQPKYNIPLGTIGPYTQAPQARTPRHHRPVPLESRSNFRRRRTYFR